jgi:hypothetical protein
MYSCYGHAVRSVISQIFRWLHDTDSECPEKSYGNVIFKHMVLFVFALINTGIFLQEVKSKFVGQVAQSV